MKTLRLTTMFFAIAALMMTTSVARAESVTVAGTVADESGNPVKDATVSVVGLDIAQPGTMDFRIVTETKSGADGRFSLTFDKPKGKSTEGFTAAQHPSFGLAWTATRLGRSLTDLRLVLPKRGSVQGKVTDKAGKPIKDAVVSALISLTGGTSDPDLAFLPPCESILKAISGADGSFTLDGLPEKATLILKATHPQFAGALEGAPENMQGPPRGTINVGAKDLVIKLEKGGTIEGKVTFEDTGKPAAGVSIAARPAVNAGDSRFKFVMLGLGLRTSETDADGRYVLKGLSPAKYVLTASFADWPSAGKPVELAAGAPLTGQDIVLSKGVLVSGKFVTAGTTEPVSDAALNIRRADAEGPMAYENVSVKPDGTFSARLALGAVMLQAYSQSGGMITEGQGRKLELVAGKDQTDIVFEVQPPLTFKGKVVGPDGKAVTGAIVTRKRGPQEKTVKTAEDGSFELPIPGQRLGENEFVSIEAKHPDMAGYRGLLGKSLPTAADATGVIELRRTGTLRGRVVDKDGKPLAGARVMTMIRFEQFGASDGDLTADESGRYEVKDAISGLQYNLTARRDGYGQDTAQDITVNEGEVVEVNDLTLEMADKVIEGTVMDEDGKPLAGVRVDSNSRATGDRYTTSDAKGHFRLEKLVEGEMQIWAYMQRPEGRLFGNAKAMTGDTDVEITLASQSRPSQPEEQAASLLVDKEAPALNVAAWIAGTETALSSLKGKPVVLAFWDSAHKTSAELVAALKKVSAKYTVVAVHKAGGDAAALKKLVTAEGMTFPVAQDKPATDSKYPGATFEAYKVKAAPSVFIIDAEGKVRFQDLPPAALDQALASLFGAK